MDLNGERSKSSTDSGDKEESRPTFADLGIPTSSSAPVETVLGQRRQWNSLTKMEVAFLVISLISICGALSLTIERIVDICRTDEISSSDFTFALVLLLNISFCLFYIVNGVFGERPFEIIIFIGGVIILLGYCIVNYAGSPGTTSRTRTVKLVRLILVSALGPVDIVLGVIITKQYLESKNLIFRLVGANLNLQKMCGWLNLCESLLKCDLQLWLTLVIFIIKDGTKALSLLESLVIGIGVPYGICFAILGWFALMREKRVLSWLFYVASLAEPGYIIYKMIVVSRNWQKNKSQGELLLPACIIFASWVGLCIRAFLLISFTKCYKNFGNGLKEKLYGSPRRTENSNQANDTNQENFSYRNIEHDP